MFQNKAVHKINRSSGTATYVGETKKELRRKIHDHKTNSLDNSQILDREPVWYKRRGEMKHINNY